MNTPATAPPGVKEIEAAAEEVHRRARLAVHHAEAGDYRHAHAEAEQAQGAARRLKELPGQLAPEPGRDGA